MLITYYAIADLNDIHLVVTGDDSVFFEQDAWFCEQLRKLQFTLLTEYNVCTDAVIDDYGEYKVMNLLLQEVKKIKDTEAYVKCLKEVQVFLNRLKVVGAVPRKPTRLLTELAIKFQKENG